MRGSDDGLIPFHSMSEGAQEPARILKGLIISLYVLRKRGIRRPGTRLDVLDDHAFCSRTQNIEQFGIRHASAYCVQDINHHGNRLRIANLIAAAGTLASCSRPASG
jgi:hypothetical protein